MISAIFITGQPGSGKRTLASGLSKLFGFAYISFPDELRELVKHSLLEECCQARAALEAGFHVDDALSTKSYSFCIYLIARCLVATG